MCLGIERENQGLLKRITGAKSTISTSKQIREHEHQQKVMKLRCEIARFPKSDQANGGISIQG